MMNPWREVLTMYYMISNPDDISIANTLRQAASIRLSMLAVCYQAFKYYLAAAAALYTSPIPRFTAENFLHMLHGQYSKLEAKIPICRLCCTPSTAAATTRHLPPMSVLVGYGYILAIAAALAFKGPARRRQPQGVRYTRRHKGERQRSEDLEEIEAYLKNPAQGGL